MVNSEVSMGIRCQIPCPPPPSPESRGTWWPDSPGWPPTRRRNGNQLCCGEMRWVGKDCSVSGPVSEIGAAWQEHHRPQRLPKSLHPSVPPSPSQYIAEVCVDLSDLCPSRNSSEIKVLVGGHSGGRSPLRVGDWNGDSLWCTADTP